MQVAIYRDDREVEPGTYPEQDQIVIRAGIKTGSLHRNSAPYTTRPSCRMYKNTFKRIQTMQNLKRTTLRLTPCTRPP